MIACNFSNFYFVLSFILCTFAQNLGYNSVSFVFQTIGYKD